MVSGQSHAPAALLPGRRPGYPLAVYFYMTSKHNRRHKPRKNVWCVIQYIHEICQDSAAFCEVFVLNICNYLGFRNCSRSYNSHFTSSVVSRKI